MTHNENQSKKDKFIGESTSNEMSLYWNDAFWFVDRLNRKKTNLKYFVRSRKVFIGGIKLKQVSFSFKAIKRKLTM